MKKNSTQKSTLPTTFKFLLAVFVLELIFSILALSFKLYVIAYRPEILRIPEQVRDMFWQIVHVGTAIGVIQRKKWGLILGVLTGGLSILMTLPLLLTPSSPFGLWALTFEGLVIAGLYYHRNLFHS